MWRLVKARLAGRFTRDPGVEDGKLRTRYSLLRSTIIPPSQSFLLFSPSNLEYPPTMRPTATVRSDAPTGMFARNENENLKTLPLTLGLFPQAKLGCVCGNVTTAEKLFLDTAFALLSRASGGVLRKVQSAKKESLNTVRDTPWSGSLCLSSRTGYFRSCLSVQATCRQEPFQGLPLQRIPTPLFSRWLLDRSGGHRCVSAFFTETYSSPD